MGLDILPVIGVGEEIPPGFIIEGFDYIRPLTDDICRHHIDHSRSLGLPDVVSRQKLTVIANGPSARDVNLKNIKTPTLAVNGALGLFLKQDCQPSYWAACDPQEQVADFIPDDPPKSSIYLVASKCHPSVFEKLKDRTVWLWHVGDDPTDRPRIPECSTITLCATWLMHRIGFNDFEYWGWDGCYMDGIHHSHGKEDHVYHDRIHINYGGEMKDGEIIGGRIFETTRSWASEAHGAGQFFQLAQYFDIGVKINGDGMFEAARKSLMD